MDHDGGAVARELDVKLPGERRAAAPGEGGVQGVLGGQRRVAAMGDDQRARRGVAKGLQEGVTIAARGDRPGQRRRLDRTFLADRLSERDQAVGDLRGRIRRGEPEGPEVPGIEGAGDGPKLAGGVEPRAGIKLGEAGDGPKRLDLDLGGPTAGNVLGERPVEASPTSPTDRTARPIQFQRTGFMSVSRPSD